MTGAEWRSAGVAYVPVAEVVRGSVVESVHHGAVVALHPDGTVALALGDPDAVLLPRSSFKPVQAAAMLRAGVALGGEELALACASHNGEPAHLDVVRRVLADAGLGVGHLQNTPDLPLDDGERLAWRRAGRGPEPLAQNCSGKHAAMLATCVAAGWATESYLDGDHRLHRTIHATTQDLTGVPVEHVTVDGCGAPLLSSTLRGLARAFSAIAVSPRGTAEHAVAAAVRAHPWHVGGTGRDVTDLLTGVPGLVAKDGAEGVYAAALDDGTSVALKVADGGARPRAALMAAVLAHLGRREDVLSRLVDVPVLGHGRRVGSVRILV